MNLCGEPQMDMVSMGPEWIPQARMALVLTGATACIVTTGLALGRSGVPRLIRCGLALGLVAAFLTWPFVVERVGQGVGVGDPRGGPVSLMVSALRFFSFLGQSVVAAGLAGAGRGEE